MSKGKQRMPNPNRNQRYEKIQDDIRAEILFRCLIMNEPLRPICKELGINFSSAKNVVQVYKKEGRLNKKTSRLKRTANGELVERIDEISHQTIEELKKKLCPIKVVKNDISGDILLERNDEIYIPMSGRTGYDCIKIKHDLPSYLEKFTDDNFEEVLKIAERDLEKLQNH